MASQITSLATVYSTVYTGTDQTKISKLRITGLCKGNSSVTDEFSTQRASNGPQLYNWIKGVQFQDVWLCLNKICWLPGSA